MVVTSIYLIIVIVMCVCVWYEWRYLFDMSGGFAYLSYMSGISHSYFRGSYVYLSGLSGRYVFDMSGSYACLSNISGILLYEW